MIQIIGAGLAGLLAGNMIEGSEIFEKQNELPNNHGAVLRFRSSTIGDIVRIPFRKVQLIKTTLPWRNPVASALAYSRKNNMIMRSDRSIATDQLVVADRYIAPGDFINQLAENVDIHFGNSYGKINEVHPPTISTIPMPVLMQILKYGSSPFQYVSGYTVSATIPNCDAFVSIITPDPFLPFSRISITGNILMIECTTKAENDDIIELAKELLGFDRDIKLRDVERKRQEYFKINPIDEGERRQFMFWATDNYNIYSLGRFATWRPGLLLDDLVNDIRLIDGWIKKSDRYGISKHRSTRQATLCC